MTPAVLEDRALFLERWRQLVLSSIPDSATAGQKEFKRLVETTWTGRASPDSVAYRLVRVFRTAFVRTGTPDAAVDAIAQAVHKATLGQDFIEFCRAQGLEPAFEDGKAWLEALPAERTYLNGLLRQSGLLAAK